MWVGVASVTKFLLPVVCLGFGFYSLGFWIYYWQIDRRSPASSFLFFFAVHTSFEPDPDRCRWTNLTSFSAAPIGTNKMRKIGGWRSQTHWRVPCFVNIKARWGFICMTQFVKCLMSFTEHELWTVAELKFKIINKNRPIRHAPPPPTPYTHTHSSETCLCMCTCTHIMYGHADEAVAANGWRKMMDGRCLMTVLGGCSLSYIFTVNLSGCLTPPSPALFRWWVMEGGSLPYQFFSSLPVGVSATVTAPHPTHLHHHHPYIIWKSGAVRQMSTTKMQREIVKNIWVWKKTCFMWKVYCQSNPGFRRMEDCVRVGPVRSLLGLAQSN